ncbi:hypothetical protein I3843_05G195600 [Carya illinoinensis]|nr:hypothetical protein I3843_05G195600 [Carya illinoinensis]
MAFLRILFQVACVVVMLSNMAAAAVASLAKPNCQHLCGVVEIPYPFGTTENCYLNDKYFINCSNSIPLLGNLIVNNINSIEGELEIMAYIAHHCYENSRTGVLGHENHPYLRVPDFTISHTKNNFVAIGCDTYAFLNAFQNDEPFSIGCTSTCQSLRNVFDGSCLGLGCCQVQIPKGLKNFTLDARSYNNHTKVSDFNPCSFALVAKEDEFNFSSSYLKILQDIDTYPMVLDWAIGSETCETARSKPDYYVCGRNSACYDPQNGDGYRCKCNKGYKGNPYLHEGCQDINECLQAPKPCNATAKCINTEGSFNCTCPDDYEGDGKMNGTGCSPKASGSHAKIIIIALIAISIGLMVLFVGGSSLYCGLKRRKLFKLKEKFFQQNGGLLLQQKLSNDRTSMQAVKIFSMGELEKATNNYDESRVLGQGSYGTVYKGVLADNKLVAIKKSKFCDQSQIEQFINEMIVLSQINHRNVVKLLGCCLETEVPLLVYEFITNGTLSKHIHDKVLSSSLSWEKRLKIATDIAGALAYMHFSTSMPIIHRDVKPANILLDDNYSAKVSDFGTSRLVPLDQTQLTTLVQGTLGYLDPEYFHSSQLTGKSDVYSFGVVVAELLTGKKAISFDGPEIDRNLAMYFSSAVKEDRLRQILVDDLVSDGNIYEINKVANLVKRCLSIKGEDRPTMKDVGMELDGLRSMEKHQLGKAYLGIKETDYCVTAPAVHYFNIGGDDGCSSTSTRTTVGYEISMRTQVSKPLDDGR